ncbi:DUF5134 domain-containing protein [Streptomyces sp. NBC_00444]|uniref:DUF5134 domain-containing protein n=1 Tax=Streptomyces sp. NBC_00444 TaxID=2975744 RepID=UPI003FA6E751
MLTLVEERNWHIGLTCVHHVPWEGRRSMSATYVVCCMLTVLFVTAAVHELRHRVLPRSYGWRMRIDGLLHTIMAVAMSVMPWSWGTPVPAGTQAAFFAAAALWFPLSTLSRSHGARLIAVARSIPSAAAMAAMVWMARPTESSRHEDLAAHAGHSMGEPAGHDVGTGVLVLYLLVCALRSLTGDMPGLRRNTRHPRTLAIKELYGHFWQGAMHLGTVVMLLVHQ